MFNRSSFMFSAALMALQAGAMTVSMTDMTPHHMRRGNGHRITGFSGDLIRQMNRTNGVGAPNKALRQQKAEFLHEIAGIA